jgi:hypothetical protein
VPQTRRRAFLLASRTQAAVCPPRPSHTRYDSRTPRTVPPRKAWLSMADGIGRGLTDRPAFTVTTRGNAWGGSSVRNTFRHLPHDDRPAPSATARRRSGPVLDARRPVAVAAGIPHVPDGLPSRPRPRRPTDERDRSPVR